MYPEKTFTENNDLSPEKIYRVETIPMNVRLRLGSVLRKVWLSALILGVMSVYFHGGITMMAMFLSLTVILALAEFLVRFIDDSTQNTQIALYRHKIVRTGIGLRHAEIALKEIGKIWEDEKGLWIFKKGLKTDIKFYLSDLTKFREKDIIFIPNNIKQYAQLKNLLFSLKPE